MKIVFNNGKGKNICQECLIPWFYRRAVFTRHLPLDIKSPSC